MCDVWKLVVTSKVKLRADGPLREQRDRRAQASNDMGAANSFQVPTFQLRGGKLAIGPTRRLVVEPYPNCAKRYRQASRLAAAVSHDARVGAVQLKRGPLLRHASVPVPPV